MGSPAFSSDFVMHAISALFECSASLPPLTITAFPLFTHKAATSVMTLGRDSKMDAITPIGTRTRLIVIPFVAVHSFITFPTGSSDLAISRSSGKGDKGMDGDKWND